MRKLLKDKLILTAFVVIASLSLFVYFNDYYSLVNFHLDPPLHLTEAQANFKSGKISLIGPSIASKEVMGRNFFLGPFYYYVLEVLGVLTDWNVIAISAFFTFLWPLTFIIIFIWFYKRFGGAVAILSYSILAFIPWYVMMSRQIWNPQPVPIIGILFIIFLLKGRRKINYFWAGLFWGLGLAFEYLTGLWVVVAGYFVVNEIRSKQFRLANWLMIPLGIAVAEFPLILFEIRHNFYNLRTILFHIQYGQISQGYKFGLVYYYAYSLLPFTVYVFGLILSKLRKRKYFNLIFVLGFAISAILLIQSLGPSGRKPLYPPGWSVQKQKDVAAVIINDHPTDFEVAETINADTRAMDLRWWLENAGVSVMGFAGYSSSPVLYLVTTDKRPPEVDTVWEVSSMRPFRVEFKKDMGDGILLYKLVRI
jgi:hypothetical protein